jgi:hypothetical protein
MMHFSNGIDWNPSQNSEWSHFVAGKYPGFSVAVIQLVPDQSA